MTKIVTGILSFLLLSLPLVSQVAQSDPSSSVVPFGSNTSPMQKTTPPKPAAQWSSLPDMPAAKGYNAGCFLNGALYTFGGLGSTGSYHNNCYKFDIAQNRWSEIAPLTTARALALAEAINGKIYIIGGYSSTNPFTSQGTVLEYDPSLNTYTTKSAMPLPVYGGGSFVHNNRIWILGGGTTSFQTSVNTIQIYDPAQDRWTTSTSQTPYPVRAEGVANANGNVLFFGGIQYQGTTGTFYPSAYKGVITGDNIAFTKIADYPGGSIMRPACGSDGSKIYTTGGYDQVTNSTGVPSSATYIFDPANNSWASQELKPTPSFYSSPMIFDGQGKFYVAGGTVQGGGYTTKAEVFNASVSGTPRLSVSTNNLEIWTKKGTVNGEKVVMKNVGAGSLSWSVGADVNWIGFSQTSGSVDAGKSTTITVSVDGGALTNGVHIGNVTITSNDPDMNSYVIAVQARVQDQDVDAELNVLLEEGTGTWCGYCPYGVDVIKTILGKYPTRVKVLSYHGGSGVTTTTEVMYTPSTTTWAQQVGLTGWPNGSVNRKLFEGETRVALGRGVWEKYVDQELQNNRSPVSINIKSKSYNLSTKMIDLTVEVFFHRDVNVPVRLCVAQVQDKLNWTQVYYPPSGGTTYLYPYYHDHTVRQIIPNDFGEIINAGNNLMPSQSSVSKTFSFLSKDSTIETSSLILYAHVTDGTTFGEVLQSKELTLTNILSSEKPVSVSDFALSRNYPNPFNPSTTITYDVPFRAHVSIVVTDVYGRQVATLVNSMVEAGRRHTQFHANALPSGSYFITMRAGSFVQTRTMTLMK